MRIQISCLLAGLLLCASGGPACAAAPAASENFPAELTASGEISCGQFIESRRANNMALNNLLVVWVWRFLIDSDHSGFFDMKVAHASGQVDLPDQAAVLSFLEHFCEHNPLSNVYNGALALLKSRQRSGVESTQTAIVGRLRVRKTKTLPEGGAVFGWWRASA